MKDMAKTRESTMHMSKKAADSDALFVEKTKDRQQNKPYQNTQLGITKWKV